MPGRVIMQCLPWCAPLTAIAWKGQPCDMGTIVMKPRVQKVFFFFPLGCFPGFKTRCLPALGTLTGFAGRECGRGYFAGILTVRQTVLWEEKLSSTHVHNTIQKYPGGLRQA